MKDFENILDKMLASSISIYPNTEILVLQSFETELDSSCQLQIGQVENVVVW